jgi:excisionase family DNA binding protein
MFEQHLGRSVTIDQAAALLHVSRRTIYNRIRDGKLQTIRTIGGSQRVLLSSLDENRRPVWSAVTQAPAGAPDTPPDTFALAKGGADSGTRES